MCQVILTIQQVVVKGHHECPVSVEVSERFVAQKNRVDRGNALKVVDTIHERPYSKILHFTTEKLAAKSLSSPMSSPGGFTVLSLAPSSELRNCVRSFFGHLRYVRYDFNNCWIISFHRISSVKHFLFDLWKHMEIDDNRCQSMTIDDNR